MDYLGLHKKVGEFYIGDVFKLTFERVFPVGAKRYLSNSFGIGVELIALICHCIWLFLIYTEYMYNMYV